jgi:hypothetical protein
MIKVLYTHEGKFKNEIMGGVRKSKGMSLIKVHHVHANIIVKPLCIINICQLKCFQRKTNFSLY